MYELEFDEQAIDFLNKLPKLIGKRIFEKIRTTKPNPFHYFDRLEGKKEYKLRIGDYRVIADISRAKKVIEIIIIGHRKKIYDKN